MAVCACANRTALKILASSQAGPDNYIVHYYQDGGREFVNWDGRAVAGNEEFNLAWAKPVR